jgi:hypothetical protein
VENPADLASRGAPAQALVESQLWWNGPAWLKKGEDEWPNSPQDETNETQQEIEQEATGKVVNVSLAVRNNLNGTSKAFRPGFAS